MDQTEGLIISQLKEGNERAYKYLYDHYYQVLCRTAVQYVHDDFLAETIVGDVIFHLWEIRDKVEITTSLRSYLLSCVRHQCIDYSRSAAFKHEGLHEALTDSIQSFDSSANYLLSDELERRITDCISKMPSECRRVFVMSRFDHKKNQEIADSIGISVNTVKYHLKNALSLLRKELKDYLVFLPLFFLLYE